MVGLIADGKANISLAPLTVTEARAEVLGFTSGYIDGKKELFMEKGFTNGGKVKLFTPHVIEFVQLR